MGIIAAAALAGCASSGPSSQHAGEGPRSPDLRSPHAAATTAPRPQRPQPRIVAASRFLQCVPYARAVSRIEIRGNASTWWRKAEGRYRRGRRPAVGAVIAMGGTSNGGHIAVVTRVLNAREIVVSHANWLNRGRVHTDTPMKDVSKHNDWSRVRVWYTPGNQYGRRAYPVRGFIYPEPLIASR